MREIILALSLRQSVAVGWTCIDEMVSLWSEVLVELEEYLFGFRSTRRLGSRP